MMTKDEHRALIQEARANMEFFAEQHDELQDRYSGRWVLIDQQRVAAVEDTQEAALAKRETGAGFAFHMVPLVVARGHHDEA